jgi:hypothetical protein
VYVFGCKTEPQLSSSLAVGPRPSGSPMFRYLPIEDILGRTAQVRFRG